LLRFYAEAGVDALLDEEPADRLSAPPIESAPGPEPRVADAREVRLAPPPRANPDSAPATPEIAVMAAREAARSAASLTELREILAKFEGCAYAGRETTVFADGSKPA
jgi:DNA polymerase